MVAGLGVGATMVMETFPFRMFTHALLTCSHEFQRPL